MKFIPALLVSAVLLSGGTSPIAAQTAADSAAIRATVMDYAEGWYAADAARMARSLHPRLSKRIVRSDAGPYTLQEMSAAQLTEATRTSGGGAAPGAARRADVQILDIFEGTASVRLTMNDWVDYMHVARWEDGWVIVNVLWQVRR